MNFIELSFFVRNGPAIRFQAVFSPGTANALAGRLTGPETLRVALKPLKASNQPGQITKIFNHEADPRYWYFEVPIDVGNSAALRVNLSGSAATLLCPCKTGP
jgi:hypothetical protein